MKSANSLRGRGEGEGPPLNQRPAGPDGSLDAALRRRFGLAAGVDEVGRGALAGPVVAAAVVLGDARLPAGIDDSKRVPPQRRARLDPHIREHAVCWSITMRDAACIDRINILEATREAMLEAVGRLDPRPGCIVVDAVPLEALGVPLFAQPHADSRYLCVAAASIIAKVARDAMMREFARDYPGYGWEHNAGYGTPEHLDALRRLGPSPLHRRSFAPLRVLAFMRG